MTTDHAAHNAAGPPLDEMLEVIAGRVLAEHPDDERGRMLHSPGLRTSGRFYAFATSTHLVVKLPAERVAALVADGAGSPCDPRGGHPMREWVLLVPRDTAEAAASVREARAFVAHARRHQT